MTDLILRRMGPFLVPVDEADEEVLARLAEGQIIRAGIKAKRNVRQHRLFWVLIHKLVANSETFPSDEAAADSVKIGVGHVETGVDAWTGRAYIKPKSISFESMEGAAFTRFFDRCIFLICNRWLVGVDEESLRQEILDIVDGPQRASLGRRVS